MREVQKKRKKILEGKSDTNYFFLFLVSFFISFGIIQNSLPNQFHLENNFWMLELIILLVLSHIIMKTKIGNHHKFAVIITAPLLIFEIIGLFLPYAEHNCEMTEKECKNKYLSDNNFFTFLWIKYGKILS